MAKQKLPKRRVDEELADVYEQKSKGKRRAEARRKRKLEREWKGK